MRLVDYRRVARRRRPLAIVTALGVGLAVLTAAAVAATAAEDPSSTTRRMSAARARRTRSSRRSCRLHQRPGRAAELQLPAADARDRGRGEDGERRARRRPRASRQAEPVLHRRRPRRKASAAASRWPTTRHVKVVLYGVVVVGNQSIYATIKGSKPIVGGVTAQPGRPDGEERVLPQRQPDERARPRSARTRRRYLPKVKTAAIVYPNQPGADTAAFALAGRAWSRSA